MLLDFPVIAGAGSLAASAAGLYYATYAVRSQWFGPTHWRGRTDTGSVALTFDDGPSQDTHDILDVLGAHGLKATFFMLGREVESFPHIARRVVEEGHDVGNHSYSHPMYLFRSARQIRVQLESGHLTVPHSHMSNSPEACKGMRSVLHVAGEGQVSGHFSGHQASDLSKCREKMHYLDSAHFRFGCEARPVS